jgi:hypothetical protein
MLTDIFIARHRNVRGQVYGFVRFSNVKNSDKLSLALNNVWFGHLRVWAREAKFDRFATNDKKSPVVSKSARVTVAGGGRKEEGVRLGGEEEEIVRSGEGASTKEMGRRGEGEKSVRVGKVEVLVNGEGGERKVQRAWEEKMQSPVLQLGDGRPKVIKRQHVVVLDVDGGGKVSRSMELEEDCNQPETNIERTSQGLSLVRGAKEYTSNKEDREWARNGLVATVGAAETILSVQHRVDDAGFQNVEVISMGGDKVFLRCRDDGDMLKTFNEAIDFFSLLFSDFHQWLSEDSSYERGAWVRVYGTPLHAWNVSFLKMCTSVCGRFVRADDCTLDKGRIDYARILLSTNSLEVLNENMEFFVDGRKCFIEIVEEWGCNLGEDAFLTEEASVMPDDNVNEEFEHENGRDLNVLDRDVDNLIEDIHREWKEHEEKLALKQLKLKVQWEVKKIWNWH